MNKKERKSFNIFDFLVVSQNISELPPRGRWGNNSGPSIIHRNNTLVPHSLCFYRPFMGLPDSIDDFARGNTISDSVNFAHPLV
jgi:hypothetical protein